MASSGIRVEAIRFGLLVTMTLALLTVAIRISSHPAAHHEVVHIPATLPSASSPATTPSVTAPSPSATPTSSVPHPRQTTGSGTGAGGGSGSGNGPTSTKPVLPVTGWDAAARLTAAALALISAGGLTMAGSRRRV